MGEVANVVKRWHDRDFPGKLPRNYPENYPDTTRKPTRQGTPRAEPGHNKILFLMAENPHISISALANAMRSLEESNEDNTGTHEKALTENDKFRVIQDRELMSDFDREIKRLLGNSDKL